ncbi:MAG: septum formation initiator family protein [Ignavibacteria bacterium]|jgi:cell division protein FtsB|nr:septum formation initiator family protein [Ignavibacteria bacterium]MCU7503672.1 septum formation initiator family protein [Ignavibacteria bacterium]MCU7518483.1 septum formation initiator family protein [Ignavibacteria bacterium]
MSIPKILKNKKLVIAAAAVFVLTIGFLFFYKFGILQYYRLFSQKKELLGKISEVEEKNKLLKAEIDSLQTKDSKIERVAREKYHMVRKGEKVYTIQEK